VRVLLRSAGRTVGLEDGICIEPQGRFDLTVELGSGELRPGLINAHDHLHRNHFPRLGAPPYPNAYAWGEDLHRRWSREIAHASRLPVSEALLFGAFKNLVAGVTTVVHHDRWRPEFDCDFPLNVPHLRFINSLGLEPDIAAAQQHPDAPRGSPLCIHLAEGTDERAQSEVRNALALGLFNDRIVAVHAVGVSESDIATLAAHRVPIVWCPTSNAFLYGRTAPPDLLTSGVPVLLGSDSLLSGGGTLLHELRAARSLGYVPDQVLLDSIGRTAAQCIGRDAPSLDPGAPADIVFLTRPLLEASVQHVALVVVGGRPRYGNAAFHALFEMAGVPTESLRVHGAEKLIAAPLATIARRAFALTPECERIVR